MPTPKKEKILIIEGDVAFGEQVSSVLKQNGYTTFLEKNGEDGLKSMYDILPHLIILDVTLPGIDGYQIIEKKNAEPLLAKIPVFLISTQGVPINMDKVPQGSVKEFMMALHTNPDDILAKVNMNFNHENETVQAPTSPVENANGLKKKILWVEDDKLIGTILSKKIMSSGFDLFHAKNGEEAKEIINKEKFDAVVVDLLLPGMTGFDILQAIQMNPQNKGVPTMVLSNLSKPSDIEKAKMLGAKKFLVKAATSLDQIVVEIKSLSSQFG